MTREIASDEVVDTIRTALRAALVEPAEDAGVRLDAPGMPNPGDLAETVAAALVDRGCIDGMLLRRIPDDQSD